MGKKANGTLYSLYLALTQPVNPMSIVEYQRVASMKDLSLPGSRNTIDTSDRDSGLEADAVAGRRDQSIGGTLNFHPDGDSGQQVIRDAYNSERGEAYFLITANKPGYYQCAGKGIIDKRDYNFPEEAVIQMPFNVKVVGKLLEEYQS